MNNLSEYANQIEIICRNVKKEDINYKKNITIKKSGSLKDIRATEQASNLWKVKSFLKFTFLLFQSLKKVQPKWVILYDPIPLFSYRLISFFLKHKPKIWYHNHDLLEIEKLNKYSVSWFASKSERTFFSKINLFTLPSEEREKYYPLEKFSGKYIFLPNYPLLYKLKNKTNLGKEIKLIYQGQISNDHGLIELVNFISTNPTNKKISLTIIGFADGSFRSSLITLIKEKKLEDSIKVLEAVNYDKLRDLTIQNNIGIAISKPTNIQYETGSTASNKIYEYVSCGFPVILFDSESYRKKLGTRQWAFFTDLSDDSLKDILINIQKKYIEISNSAINDFESELNFNKHFLKISSYLKDNN
ncbi:glycosyltransferase [Pedobacter sp.]|uniref:glycosyltransferase n=1 Tax=Pedobacter sp. TaxID=1411316 RepID=UPI003BA94FDC